MTQQITLYHNPRCSKSREALKLLEDHGIAPVLRHYMSEPPCPDELASLLNALGLEARYLLRTNEEAYRDQRLSDPTLDDARLLEAMAADPRLIQRPIAVKGKRAVLGRPPEKILELL